MNKLVTLPNLRRVRYVRFGYENQHGTFKEELPTVPTRLGVEVDTKEKLFGKDEPLIDALKRTDCLDRWTPVIELYFTKSDILIFRG